MITIGPDVSFLTAAREWHAAGFSVIPIVPGEKRSAVKWDPWLAELSADSITAHWSEHPDHEIGFIVGDDLLVLDADGPQSVAALLDLEQQFDVEPRLDVGTRRGRHHYFGRAAGTFAKTNSHSTEAHPERIDVKTGRSLVVVPPSTGKFIERCNIESVADLVEVDQAFIDAVFNHNGADPPRPLTPVEARPLMMESGDTGQALARLSAMVYALDPDCGYDDWLHVLLAIHHETAGSEDGFALANDWSSRGGKYDSEVELRAKWKSFAGHTGAPVTLGTIIALLDRHGLDWVEICAATEPDFEPCESETLSEWQASSTPNTLVDAITESTVEAQPTAMNILAAFSLLGRLEHLEREMVEQVRLLGGLVLMGQASVIYAAPNTGKTLLILWLLIEAIRQGRVTPTRVFYINVDDSLYGLVQKLRLAQLHGFHMVSEGYQDFRARDFMRILNEVMDKGQARGVVIILDTLKKFTDLMDKRTSTAFGKIVRRLVLQGGTVLAAAHTNKKPGPDGRPIYAGTSDIIEDVDCAYTLRVISEPGAEEKVVEFENIKRRGDVVQRAVYGYSAADGLSYDQLLASVRPIKDAEATEIHVATKARADAELVDVVCDLIRSGTNTREALVAGVIKGTRCRRNVARDLLDRNCGDDPQQHRWTFDVRARGAKVYRLLEAAANPHVFDTPAADSSGEAGHE